MLSRALRAASVMSSEWLTPSLVTEMPVVAKNLRGAANSGGR